jgi:hypothetical protein
MRRDYAKRPGMACLRKGQGKPMALPLAPRSRAGEGLRKRKRPGVAAGPLCVFSLP